MPIPYLCSRPITIMMALTASLGTSLAYADQSRETETALPLQWGTWEAGIAIEYQHSSDGTETATPLAVE